MPAPPTIAPGRAVCLHLEVRFQDGFIALSTFGEEPIRCTIGDGALTPGLEQSIAGLTEGAEQTILVHGSELFGDHDPGNVHWLNAADFPPGLDPTPGQVVSFETPGGQETSGVVLDRIGEHGADRVRVDFNHPLAGRPLTLRVRVLSID
jgi:FKBP-type peptidyl-prolyl cis-trans isomerase SlpA